MKYILTVATLLFVMNSIHAQKKVNWMHWDDAIAAATDNPKKIYVDVYTDWCGYCKKMDRETFSDPKVVKYLNENFYPVKLDAEQTESINFNGTEFKHRAGGRGGVHELAVALLNNQMGYPAFVILDEEFARILISPGFKGPDDVMMEMEFANNETYKVKSWNAFQAESVAKKRAAAAAAASANPAANPAKPTAPAKATTTNRATPATPARTNTATRANTATKQATATAVSGAREAKPTAKPATPSKPTASSRYENELFKVVEDMPRFPGCENGDLDKNAKSKCAKDLMNKYIYENIKYPKDTNVEGTVVVQFEVRNNGAIENARLVRDIGGNCGAEALRVVNQMPTWIPGKQRGRPVAVLYTLPVKFSKEMPAKTLKEERKPLSKKELKKLEKEKKKLAKEQKKVMEEKADAKM